MLVELATEGNSEVACCSTGDCIGRVQRFATVIGTPALADLHVLEARLHTGEVSAEIFQLLDFSKHSPKQRCFLSHTLTGNCGDSP